ncbi:MAG: ParB/RepB/Spo0J family partition protein [Desulfobacteraceae bacterium]|nr:ParB/RepB/Spo0J family partition protein [Desulfobacteraceae bacterium]MCF8094770.1 ParB/RepB/Spo0J family partition protein [Desulfobacteraceae bacterium]
MKADETGVRGKKRKTGLGKGLDALFPEIENGAGGRETDYFSCDISLIKPNPCQPRRQFDQEDLEELAESVRAHGVLQPLLVRETGNDYQLVAGERRLRAAKMAGLYTIPVVVKSIKDDELLAFSIIENIQRADLNAMEEAEAYQRLLDEFGLTQDQVASRVGKSRSAVANFLRLNHLSDEVKDYLRERSLSMGHARALLASRTPAVQREACRAILAKGLSVRESEKLVARLNKESQGAANRNPGPQDIHIAGLEEDLGRRFGTKVKIKRSGKKGRVEIEFYDDNDLDRLLSLMQS